MANVVDGRIYKTSVPARILVTVMSGAPTLEFSLDDFVTSSTADITVSASYPQAEVNLPACKYRFALNGGSAQKTAALK